MGKKRRLTKAEIEAIEFAKKQEMFDDKLKEELQKADYKNRLSRIRFASYTKNLVAIIIFICLLDLQLTYVLAFLGKTFIAEELSKQLCITILGVAFTYMLRAYFDSKAEHNNLDNKLKKEIKNLPREKANEVLDKVSGILGISIPIQEEESKEETDEYNPPDIDNNEPNHDDAD